MQRSGVRTGCQMLLKKTGYPIHVFLRAAEKYVSYGYLISTLNIRHYEQDVATTEVTIMKFNYTR
jgi:hypothetical protein